MALAISLASVLGTDANAEPARTTGHPRIPAPACLHTTPNAGEAHDNWSSATPVLTERYLLATATGCDGTIYALGGLAATTEGAGPEDVAITDAVEAYDPFDDNWTDLAPLPTPRTGLAAATG
ncbi:kelch repeat-containing protein, partial [Streptomyces sp. CB01881]|uniref:Kelch repeat-containing protein n=1 Tax=Streptomyces sp. CB01881 TaxID=2078691 RepID=UPI001F4F1370